MALALVAHAGPSADRLHVWVGVADVGAAAPALTWRLDGNPIVPGPVRALGPVLATPADTTVHTGVFELANLAPDTEITVEVSADAERIVRRIRTLPARIPAGIQDRFNVLLVSCFHWDEDETGKAGRVLSHLGVRPHLTLFAGDQVYLDLPTLADFQKDGTWLGNKFQNDYLRNWFGDRLARADPQEVPPGYPRVLALAPSAFAPDDHEFWNNYPFWAAPVENSWTLEGRETWTKAAKAAYVGFQQGRGPLGAGRTIDVEPLSILILDTRSQRSEDSRENETDLLGQAGRDALTAWVDRLVQHANDVGPWFGMLVTGQSFFRPAAGGFKGKIFDYEYADYEADYAFMVKAIERVTRAGLPLVLATGDVHWGRVLRADDPAAGGATVFEVISSPTSLVSTVLVDEAKEVWGFFKGLFGQRDPWPRHGEPGKPPPSFGTRGQYVTQVLPRTTGTCAAMRGNQAFMLRFVRSAGGLDVHVDCYPLADDPVFDGAEQWSAGPLLLRPPRRA